MVAPLLLVHSPSGAGKEVIFVNTMNNDHCSQPNPEPRLDRIIEDIRTEEAVLRAAEDQVAGNEGRAVQALIRIGQGLVRLRAVVEAIRGSWTRQVTAIGYPLRVANRYVRLGQSWWASNSLTESVLARLPRDLEKCDWLCRLSPSQLSEVLDQENCKRLDRAGIVSIVTQMLGTVTPRKAIQPADWLRQSIRRFFASALSTARKGREEGFGPGEREDILAALDSGYRELRAALSLDATSAAQDGNLTFQPRHSCWRR